jgi:probable phosphoglycerate mutase
MIWLVRHGETEWTISGAHTGRSDIPLTAAGEEQAARVREKLAGREFGLVLSSPLQRARRTCELAGYGEQAIIDDNLAEWDYGACDGLTTAQIRMKIPGWTIFRDGAAGGETADQVAARARLVIDRCLAHGGDCILFSHGHLLRILAACWLDFPPHTARNLALGTAGVSVLTLEHETRVISRWNC